MDLLLKKFPEKAYIKKSDRNSQKTETKELKSLKTNLSVKL